MPIEEPSHRYPFHLERQFELLFERYVYRLASATLPGLEKQYKLEVRPTTDDIWDKINDLEKGIVGQADPATRGRLVNYGGVMIPVTMRDEIVKLVKELNEWNIKRVATAMRQLGSAGKLQRPRDLIISLADETPEIQRAMLRAAELNANLITTTRADYLDEIGKLTEEAVGKGISGKALAGKFQQLTGVTTSRAKFWARDQVGKMLGDFSQVRQTQAGFPGYIWITSRDARVRPDHAWRHGRFFRWDGPGLKPGEDYNCRCEARASLDPSDQISKSQWAKDINIMNKDRRKIAKLRKVEPVLLDIEELREMARVGI